MKLILNDAVKNRRQRTAAVTLLWYDVPAAARCHRVAYCRRNAKPASHVSRAEVKKEMHRGRLLSFLTVFAALLTAADQPWKDKAIADWSDEDTKQILADSPWARTVQPTMDRASSGQRQSRGMGRGGGGLGGIGIGLPGMGGMGRRGGMGYPGGNPGGVPPVGTNGGNGTGSDQPPALKLRWESALPIREAELKARETNAPTVDEGHYAIAVYGVPDYMVNGDSRALADQLKKQAAIKRDGKKDLKPSSVEVFRREDGPVILYLFPRSNEITRQDKRIEFDARILRLQFTQPFYVDEMTYRDKLEL